MSPQLKCPSLSGLGNSVQEKKSGTMRLPLEFVGCITKASIMSEVAFKNKKKKKAEQKNVCYGVLVK